MKTKSMEDKWYGIDKLLHLFVCMVIMIFVGAVCTDFGLSKIPVLIIGFWITATVAIAKEVFDSKIGGKWSWLDIYADATGIALGAVIVLFSKF